MDWGASSMPGREIQRQGREFNMPWKKEILILFSPDELFLFLGEQSVQQSNKEETIKGYRVNVQYEADSEVGRKKKQEELARVIAGSLRSMKARG
jgi:hypothetical protein